MKKAVFTNEQVEKIIEMYINGMSRTNIANHFGYSTDKPILKFLQKNNIKIRNNRKYEINENIFDVIDTEEKAYWLGFLLADGCISADYKGAHRISLRLQSNDIHHIEKFKTFLNTTSEITIESSVSPSTGKSCTNHGVKVNSNKMAQDLISHGVTIRKTGNEQPPIGIPDDLIVHFIRGYFDGDGSIGIYTDKRRDYQYPIVTFIGTEELLKWILTKLNLEASVSKQGKLFRFQFSGEKAKEITNKLYSNATIYLERKHAIAIRIGKI